MEMALCKITIEFDRPRKIYHQGEYIGGFILIHNKYELKHGGILLAMDGVVEINTNLKAINLMDTFTSSNKVIKLVDFTYELVAPGRLQPGRTKIP